MSEIFKTAAHPAGFPWLSLIGGLVGGWFLNGVIHRLPEMVDRAWQGGCGGLRGETPAGSEKFNLFVPRSRCPACGHGITVAENIPLVSWAMLRGRCSACKAPISLRYPLVELLAGVGGFASGTHFGFGLAAAGAAIFIWCTIALAFIDQETGYLYDDITLPLLWFGLLLNLGGTYVPISDAVVGAAAGYPSLWIVYPALKLVTRREGLAFV